MLHHAHHVCIQQSLEKSALFVVSGGPCRSVGMVKAWRPAAAAAAGAALWKQPVVGPPPQSIVALPPCMSRVTAIKPVGKAQVTTSHHHIMMVGHH